MAASELKETTMIIDPADLDPTSSYKLLIGSVLPRAIAWVSTSSAAGVGNIAPISFFTVVGRFPPVLSITLQPRADGETLKDTFVNIRDTNEFVVNIATIGQADAVHRSAYEFGTDVDEFEALGLEQPRPKPSRLRGSPVRPSPSSASSTASSRCRRCPTTSCGAA
jgi:flavin reductase (DIM6/NTAB) family NADH-FMN oxidoreductase RutF